MKYIFEYKGSKVNSAMAYCKFQADHLFMGTQMLDEKQVLVTDETGIIAGIVPEAEAGTGIQKLNGILMPGMINAHCHLELSHMRNQISPGGGLTHFIGQVMKTRQADLEERIQQMHAARQEMYNNGIVAVGDICNNASSAAVKASSGVLWHNFLEITNLDDSKAQQKLNDFQALAGAFDNKVAYILDSVLTPHAPYSVSPETFRLINQHTSGKTICIHNQETAAEDELFKTGSGAFLEFYQSIGRKENPLPVSGKSSLQTWLPYFNNGQRIILVHNTFTQEEDLVFAMEHAATNGLQLYFCLCPNANLYIENRLPPVELLMKYGCNILLGTDSYSSNWQLNLISEAAIIHQHFPAIGLKDILTWATLNGAHAFNIHQQFGSFEKGKKPGVVLVDERMKQVNRLF